MACRVENAGKVMQEILNAPDSIPQSVLEEADCVVVLGARGRIARN
jgi:hypothetical protein